MASFTIFFALLAALFVIVIPYPLTATKEGQPGPDAAEEAYYDWCYERCVMDEHRFPCAEDSYECGECLYPIASPGNDKCKVVQGNHEEKANLLKMISKRDQGASDIEVGTGDVQPPSQDQAQPEADQTNTDNQAEGEGEEANPQVQSQHSNQEIIEEPQPNKGSVILLAEWQFILIVCGCVAVAIVGVAVAFICWYKIQNTSKAQNEADYPAYGVTGPGTQISTNMNNGDRKLAQSAQMYHYQHQKQQMIAMEKREKGEVQRDASDYDSEEENEDGDLTVYECPGLAPTGEMQVKNPLFAEDAYPKPLADDEEHDAQ